MKIRFDGGALKIRLVAEELGRLAAHDVLEERFPLSADQAILWRIQSGPALLVRREGDFTLRIPEEKVQELRVLSAGGAGRSQLSVSLGLPGAEAFLELDYFAAKGARPQAGEVSHG